MPAVQFSLIFFHLEFSIFLSNGPRAVKSCDIAAYASFSKRMQRSHFTRMTFNAHANCRRAIRRKQLQRRINEASWITFWKGEKYEQDTERKRKKVEERVSKRERKGKMRVWMRNMRRKGMRWGNDRVIKKKHLFVKRYVAKWWESSAKRGCQNARVL